MSRGTVATIDLSALKNNLQRVHELVGQRRVLTMIKANGYGHGLIKVAQALDNADAFGVATIDEALTLREAGITKQIVVMAGFFDASEIPLFLKHNIVAVIHHQFQIDTLEKNKLAQPLDVWFKVDTGMHRLGFIADDFRRTYLRLHAIERVKKPFVIMTHLADADNTNPDFTQQQFATFDSLTTDLPELKSVGNSAGILAYTDKLKDWVRPGIMLYGASPFTNRTAEQDQLKPVMTLSSKLIAVKNLKKDDKVGYGCTWQCPEDMLMGVVAIGYGDGYPRHAQNGTPVLVNNTICPLVGRVSMDMITVDLRPCKNANVDDPVVLWGNGLPIEKVAVAASTISYELLTKITSRVNCKFI